MEMNLSIYDIALRYVLMAAFGIIGALTGMYWMVVLGIVFFLTAILGICPLYTAFGVNNTKKAKDDYK
jgi:predicted outer membrane lipoprotein